MAVSAVCVWRPQRHVIGFALQLFAPDALADYALQGSPHHARSGPADGLIALPRTNSSSAAQAIPHRAGAGSGPPPIPD
ncbi:MAG TPA: hypothetical protein VKT77_12715 [Chthonomonadaceae bacterium]|nr:hypothetical protein [Chthonomonadaceae bacterium]